MKIACLSQSSMEGTVKKVYEEIFFMRIARIAGEVQLFLAGIPVIQ